ncbi:MAG: class I SAM-dependent methyltransferase [Ignavibacteria bacterium]|jgi:cyclopropane fatty-acyl-phospholipid synthase-like methyltransferase
MNQNFENTVAKSLDISKEMTPLLPELLKGMFDLGGDVNNAVELFSVTNLGSDSKVLDLGCGKGAILIALAEKFGIGGIGIDGMKAFIDEAKRVSIEKNLTDLLKFKYGDIFKAVEIYTDFDLVVFASIGPIFGDYIKTIDGLRKTIREGGYIIFDDGFLNDSKCKKRSGYENCLTDEELINQLTFYNDVIIKEIITPKEETAAVNKRYMNIIQNNAIELKERLPDKSKIIDEYLKNQIKECEFLNSSFTSATWLIQKQE